MRAKSIFIKIFLSNAVIGLFAVITISSIFYFLIRNSLIDRTVDQLASVNTLKAEQIDSYLNQHKKDLTFLFTHEFFVEHFDNVKGPINTTTFPKEVAEEIDGIRAIYNFLEISFVGPDKTIAYSTSRDPVFSTKSLPVADKPDDFNWIDASNDYPDQRPVLLYIIPIVRADMFVGLVVVTENFDKVEKLLLENAGMGTTGESYLVGPDNKLRSASRFFPERPPLSITVSYTDEPNPDHIRTDYRGETVISFARPLENPALKWKIISEIDVIEALEPATNFRNYLLIITVISAVLILSVSVFISNEIAKPVLRLRDVIKELAKGILPDTPVTTRSKDEIGQITNEVNQLVAGLRRTTEFAYQIGQGNFQTQYTSLSDSDTLGLALIDMRDQLKQFNEREVKLVRDKAAALLEGQENERKRIIQELHDGVGQLLTAIRLRIDVVPLETNRRKELVDLLNETIAEVKRISYNVMPGSLVDFGLEAALKGLCDNTSKYSKLKFDFQYIRESDHQLGFDVTVAVFRIVQEGINNIIKHASAQNVELHILDKEDEIYVLLKDDGKGFEEKLLDRAGMGLRSMKERAKLLGGNVDIHSEPNEGTAIEAHIPLPTQKIS
ncbi:MAG TPA: ATP-binding protein [Cyclobacteriaceae bacterium]|nr:ATP-binding protein [Cyclobacteriaceae bacterium]